MVAPLILATMPRAMASRARSWRLNRDRGNSVSEGSSQARALTCTTTSGGKNGRSPGSWFVLQTGQASLKESFAPLANDLARGRETGGNLVIGAALRGQEDYLGAKDRIIR